MRHAPSDQADEEDPEQWLAELAEFGPDAVPEIVRVWRGPVGHGRRP